MDSLNVTEFWDHCYMEAQKSIQKWNRIESPEKSLHLWSIDKVKGAEDIQWGERLIISINGTEITVYPYAKV